MHKPGQGRQCVWGLGKSIFVVTLPYRSRQSYDPLQFGRKYYIQDRQGLSLPSEGIQDERDPETVDVHLGSVP